ncbi:MAG: ATP-binding protein [Candidatus Micrarchaeota archaeon]
MQVMLGTIISNEEGPSTHEFSFVLSPGQVAAIGQLVKVPTQSGEIIALAKKITRQNRYYQFAESISQYAKESKTFDASFPARDWEYIVVSCSILGVFQNHLLRCSFPPSPGDSVAVVEDETAAKVLGVSPNGLNIGTLLASNLQCKVDLSRLLQKHLAVLGMSGSGKSHLMAVIIEELLSRDKENGRLSVIVLDPHGDYASFAHPGNAFHDRTQVIKGENVKISVTHLSSMLLSELVPSITSPARREYSKILAKVKRACEAEGKLLTLDELIVAAEENTRSNLADVLNEVKHIGLFDAFDEPSMNFAKPGRLTIFDLSNTSAKVKQVIAAFYGRNLFSMRKQGKVPPFVLIAEEAHVFAREKAKSENAISKPVIESIAREGRKFGACLCLVSQRPVQLSTTALSQCNSFIVMRVTNPYDLQHIGESCEGIDKNTLDAITSLRTGEGIVIGEALNFPAFVKVRPREFKGAASAKLEDIAKDFETRSVAISEKDAGAAFL